MKIDWLELWKGLWRGLVEEHGKPLGVERGVSTSLPLPSGYDRDLEEMSRRRSVCDYALSQQGKPYKLGVEVGAGEEAEFWDCSELVQEAYRQAGMTIPDGSFAQFDFCRPVKEPKLADLGFLWNDKWGRIGHVAIFIGGDMLVDAVGGSVGRVRLAHQSLIEESPRFRGWRRFPDFQWPLEDRA